jgi:bla regulator protein blaR1
MLWERERACDEEVLQLGSEPQVYAEGILNVCKLYMESPLVCMSGVTGANLKRRIELIMAERPVFRVKLAKRAMLGSAAVAALVLPIAIGIIDAPMIRAQSQGGSDWQAAAGGKMAFEVASVKLDNGPFRPPKFPLDSGSAYTATGGRFFADFPVTTCIRFAYKLSLTREQMKAMPKWVTSDRFVVEAKAPIENPTKDQMRLMMQSLLFDRFRLSIHFETRTMPVLALRSVTAGKSSAM